MNEIKNIISLIENTFEKNPWHGPSVKDALKNLSQEQSFLKLNDSHTIIGLVNHMTAWRNYVVKKVGSDPAFQITPELNFPIEINWLRTTKKLEESQTSLIDSLKTFDTKKLSALVPFTEHSYTWYTLLHGIIHHDLYHTGQIMIIRKHFGI